MPPSAKCSAWAFRQPPNIPIDGEALDLGKAGDVGGVGLFRRHRAIIVPGDQPLTGRRIKIVEIGPCHLQRAVLRRIALDQGDRRLGQDGDGGDDDLELVGAEFVDGQERLVLPGQQNVADAAPHEGRGRTARPGVEDRYIAEDGSHEIARLGLVAAPGLERVSPGRQIVQRAPPEVFGLGVMTCIPGLARSGQSWMPLGLPLCTRKTRSRYRARCCAAGGTAVGRNQAGLLGDDVDVIGQGQRHHVGGQPVDHRPSLLAGTAVRHPHGTPFPPSSPSSPRRTPC